MSIHHQAMLHLDKAIALLADGHDDQLRYAALEIRHCIEHLFYELIPVYRDELPDNLHRGDIWQPAAIIDMIADIDPGVFHDRAVRMRAESAPGVPSTRLVELGRQTGLRPHLARRTYHRLGSYLHARVDQQPHDLERLRARLLKLLPYLEQFRNDRVLLGGVAERAHFKCTKCGRPILHRTEAMQRNPYVRCPNDKCSAIYKSVTVDDGESAHQLAQEPLKCEACNRETWFGIHDLKRIATQNGLVACSWCEATYQLFEYVAVKRYDPPTVAAVDDSVAGDRTES